jgi:hypothetical protein
MKRERGCGRNYGMNGGGTATYSMGGMVAPGSYAAVTVDGGACSSLRPGVVHVTPQGLMGGGRRHRNKSRRMRGGRYGFDLTGQGMAPNQYAAVVPMRGESCSLQAGGGPELVVEAQNAGYSYGGELVTNNSGGVVPVGGAVPYTPTHNPSNACLHTGGGRRYKKSRKARKSRKTKKSRANKSRKHTSRKHKSTRRH